MLSLDIEPYNDPDNDESSFYDRLFSEYTKTPEQIYIEKETYEEVHHALNMISPRERTYLRYRYGFIRILHHRLAQIADRSQIRSQQPSIPVLVQISAAPGKDIFLVLEERRRYIPAMLPGK